ncbi:MAG: OmpA family protein, partial [Bacteroidota bacterium]
DLLIKLSPIREGAKVELNNLFFASGSYELEETSEAELTFLYNYLQQNPRLRIQIQGHTDDVGSDTDNLRLSQQRAEAVRTYLLNRGIAETRVEAQGFGETQSIASNETEEGRAANRRTEFEVLKNQ